MDPGGQLARQAAGAGAADFHGGAFDGKSLPFRPGAEAVFDDGIGEFVDLAAGAADGKGDQPGAVAMLVGTGDKGIERFKAMGEAAFDQFFQSAIDLQWCTQAFGAQLVEQLLG